MDIEELARTADTAEVMVDLLAQVNGERSFDNKACIMRDDWTSQSEGSSRFRASLTNRTPAPGCFSSSKARQSWGDHRIWIQKNGFGCVSKALF